LAVAFIEITVDPVVVLLGGYALRWYGVFLALGVLVGLGVAFREARRRSLGDEAVNAAAFWGLLAGLVAARLFHVVDYPEYYRLNPQLILALHQGGMSLLGGLLVGGGVAALVCRRRGLPLPAALDAAAAGLAFGIGVGRLGSLINGDAAGNPSTLPWAVIYRHPDSLAYQLDLPVHPYPAYEILLSLGILGLMVAAGPRLRRPGAAFGFWAVLFGLGRFGLTFTRPEPAVLFNIRQSQALSVVLVVIGLTVLWQSVRRPAAGDAAAEPVAPVTGYGP
jgi:phosphatidylglycerol:prolipoprotein diacylglycerol transferase